MDYMDWPGFLGTYRYWRLPNPFDPKAIKHLPGNYMMVAAIRQGLRPVYIGRSDDSLADRIPFHERMDDAIAAGAAYVYAAVNTTGNQARRDEEIDLIARWQPILNVQHRAVPRGLIG